MEGPNSTTYLVATPHQPAAWAAVVFGCLTLGASFSGFLDATLQGKSSSKRSQHSLDGWKRRTGTLMSSEARWTGYSGERQLLSRSLPPVPESIGGGVSQVQNQTRHILSRIQSVTGFKSPEEMLTTILEDSPSKKMKFGLVTNQRQPEASVMMPVESEAKFLAQQDEQTAKQHSWRGLGTSRRKKPPKAEVTRVPENVTQASFMSDELQSRPDCVTFDVLPPPPRRANHPCLSSSDRSAQQQQRDRKGSGEPAMEVMPQSPQIGIEEGSVGSRPRERAPAECLPTSSTDSEPS